MRTLDFVSHLSLTIACCTLFCTNKPDLDPGAGLDDSTSLDAAAPVDLMRPIEADGSFDMPPVCPRFSVGVSQGTTPKNLITEASGIAASQRSPGVLWVHNDSGAGPRIFALSSMATLLAQYDLGGADARDWEDIAVGPGPLAGTSYLYVGDIGDNSLSRSSIAIYRVAEPDARTGSPTAPMTLPGVERFPLVYPDGPHNAETLLVDPRTGDVYVVVKSSDGRSPVFRAAAPLSTERTQTMERVAELQFGVPPLSGNRTTTGGDMSPTGDEVAIRTYDRVFLWRRGKGQTIAEALTTAPCVLPLQPEGQGEALGFAHDGSGYYTVSEGVMVPLFFYARR